MIKIVGAGITGLTFARRLAEEGHKVIVYDKNNYVGGLLYDYLLNGFYVSDSGVHIFHTDDEILMKYISKFGTFINFNHVVSADVYGTDFAINFPTSNNNRLTEEQFKNLYYFYSIKQWGKMPSQSVLDRCKPRNNNSLFFFKDKYVAIPLYGWTNICNNMASHSNIELKLNYEFTLKDINKNDKIYFTGRLDKLFDFKYGEMKFRTIKIINSTEGNDFASVMNKSLPNCEYTRVINWRRCSPLVSTDKDLYGYEYSQDSKKDEISPHYIVDGQEEIYNKYLLECEKYNIKPFGRIGGNKYINIEEGIKCGMTLPL